MTLCNDSRHEAIAFSGGPCPLCSALNEIEGLKQSLKDNAFSHQVVYQTFESKIADLQKQLERQKGLPANVVEALNMGDGSYRP